LHTYNSLKREEIPCEALKQMKVSSMALEN